MSWFDKVRQVLSGQRMCTPEHLESYVRLGNELYAVEVELADCQNPKVRVILIAAKCFQIMGNALLQDAFPSNSHESKPVPIVTHEQAEAWYKRIPDLMIAARQEAAFVNSAKIRIPIRLEDRIELNEKCPTDHLAGLRRAANEVEALFKDKMEFARRHADQYKRLILLYEEARTRKQVADAIVGSLLGGAHVSSESHEEAESQYWFALSNYIIIGQGLEDPSILDGSLPTSETKSTSKLDVDDVWKITSKLAVREIRQSGEWDKAVEDLAELWRLHRITEEERVYEREAEALFVSGKIAEDSYWYCCPFQSVYKVVHGPIRILGRSIPTGHVFVWDYGEDGSPGRFITEPTFRSSARQYCADED